MEEEEKGTGGGVALGKTKSARHKEKREDDREQATQAGFGKAIKNSLYDIANRFIEDFGRGLLECVTNERVVQKFKKPFFHSIKFSANLRV